MPDVHHSSEVRGHAATWLDSERMEALKASTKSLTVSSVCDFKEIWGLKIHQHLNREQYVMRSHTEPLSYSFNNASRSATTYEMIILALLNLHAVVFSQQFSSYKQHSFRCRNLSALMSSEPWKTTHVDAVLKKALQSWAKMEICCQHSCHRHCSVTMEANISPKSLISVILLTKLL